MKSPQQLVQQFVNAAIKENAGIKDGPLTTRTAKKYYQAMIEAVSQLVDLGDAGEEALTVLLSHETDVVRVKAAMFYAKHNPGKCIPILKELASRSGVVGLNATMMLRHGLGDGTKDK